MAEFEGFIGPSYTSRAVNVDAERSVNLYVETQRAGTGKSGKALLGSPGLTLWLTLPTTPVRALYVGQGRVFAVAGSKFYEVYKPIASVVSTSGTAVTWVSGMIFPNTLLTGGATSIIINGVSYGISAWNSATSLTLQSSAGTQTSVAATVAYTTRGDVGNDGKPAQIFQSSSAGQLFVVSDGQAWIDTGSGPTQALYTDGTGTVDTSGTAVTWDSGDYFTTDGTITGPLDTGLVGNPFVIGSTTYIVASVNSATSITLTATAGTQTGAVYNSYYYVTASSGAFLDSYFIAVKPDSIQFNISAAGDGTSWNPIDFASKEAAPDQLVAVFADREQLWLLGAQTIEVWQDTGSAGFPFQRFQGGFIPRGLAAIASVVKLGGNDGQEGIAWIGADPRGRVCAYRGVGGTAMPVSTPPVEAAWSGYSTVCDAVSFVWASDAHEFWVIQFPTAGKTWCYDAVEAAWHELATWNGSTNVAWRVSSHGEAWGLHLAGDATTGNIYTLSLAVYTDNGQPIVRQRTAPHLSEAELWTFYSRFRLALLGGTASWSGTVNTSATAITRATGAYFTYDATATGAVNQQLVGQTIVIGGTAYTVASVADASHLAVTATAGTHSGSAWSIAFNAPDPTLGWSDDLGITFNSARAGTARRISSSSDNANQMTEWRRLGRARDRVFQVLMQDPVQIALTGAFLEATSGNG